MKFKLERGGRINTLNKSILWLGVIVLAVIMSLFISIEAVLLILPISIILFACVVLLVVKLNRYRVSFLWLSLAVLQFFSFPLIYMVSGLPMYVVMQLYLMAVGLPFLRYLYDVIKNNALLVLSFSFLAGYYSVTIISTLVPTTYNKSALAIGYQSVALIKPYLILAFCFGMFKLYGTKVREFVYNLGAWLWLPMLILVVIQFSMPGVFKAVFPFASVSPEESGLFPSRGLGMFESSSYLAAFAAFYAIFFCAHALSYSQNYAKRIRCLFLTGIYVLLVLLAIQRQELSALFLSLVVVFIFYRSKYICWRSSIAAVLLVFGVTAFMWLFGDMTEKEFSTWGENRYAAITHPRANLYDAAFAIADDYFPLGSGIGSYAGAGATKFNLELFYKMGFAKLWWFGNSKEKFLLDSYWANPIAEAGYIGSGCLILHYIVLLIALIRRLLSATEKEKTTWLVAVGSFLYVLMTSVTSPSFIEPRIIFFPFLAIAMAYGVSHREGKQ